MVGAVRGWETTSRARPWCGFGFGPGPGGPLSSAPVARRTSPLSTSLVVALACAGPDHAPESDADRGTEAEAAIPFADRSLDDRDFVLVSGARDTLRFRVEAADGSRVRLARTRRRPAGTDSMAAVVDARTLAPIESYRRIHTADGDILTARIVYGAGFEGDARLTMTTPGGSRTANIHAPAPVLDAAQIPLVLAGLELGEPDTISFNYVAPFEGEALAARLLVGGLDTLDVGPARVPAYPVELEVSGLEERYWFSAAGPERRLLRIDEITRRTTWTRPDAATGPGR